MRKSFIKDYLRYFGPALVLTLIGFIIASQFVSPAPPRQITIATGPASGNYYRIGQEYSALLASDRVTLVVRETSGSVENLKLIADRGSGVDVIFMQGGTAGKNPYDGLVALGSLYYEPLWIFYRQNLNLSDVNDLRGLRIAVGPDNSGTQALVMQLLSLNGVGPENSRILNLPGVDAGRRLLDGQIDVAFFVIGQLDTTGLELLRSPRIRLLELRREEAYTRRLPFLSQVFLPEGAIDLASNLPSRSLRLIAPTAQLVVRNELHPALIGLLLQAAVETGAAGGLFAKPGDFPNPNHTDFPLSSEAKRYYVEGPPFLRRYMPFWLANFLNRMKIMLLPLIALLLPLARLLPPFYRWRVRSRIFRWYDEILEIDYKLLDGDIARKKEEFLDRLNWIEHEVSHISVPRGYYRELYDMRIHIEMLRAKLKTIPDELLTENGENKN